MRNHSPGTDGGESRGAILLIVLWAVAMMTVVIAALATNVRTSASLAGTETRRLKTEMVLEGGVDVAAAAILASGDQVRTLSDGHTAQIDLGNGNIASMAIRDAGGLVDINRADPALLAGIVTQVTGSSDTGKAIADQITQARSTTTDSTDNSQAQTAEASSPTTDSADNSQPAQAQSNPEAAGNSQLTFITAAQLYNISGIDAKVVAGLLPFINVFSKEGHINIAAAPDQVIAGIPNITPLQIDTIKAARTNGSWDSSEIKDIADNLSDHVSVDPTNVFIVDLSLVQSPDLIVNTHLRTTIIVDQSADTPFHVLARSW